MGDWLLRNSVTIALLIVLTRWVARPMFGKLGLIEALMVNAIGDLASHSVFETQHPYWPGFASIAAWMAFAALAGHLASRWPWFRQFYYGETHEILRDGKPDPAAMRKMDVCWENLTIELRKHGLAEVAQAKKVSVEPDGSLSVIQADKTAEELRRLSDTLARLADQLSNKQ